MPTIYPTVTVAGHTGDGGKGQRNNENLKKIFASSPVYTDYSTTAVIRSQKDVDGAPAGQIVTGESPITRDAGVWGLNTVSLEFADAPDISKVETGGGGLPATPYVPNPSSPGGTIGVTNDNPADKPAAPDSFVNMKGFGGATGGGPSMIDSNGNPITPSATAAEISNSSKSPGTTGESAWTNSQALNSQTPSPGIGSTS